VSDGVALVVFVALGNLTHGTSVGAFGRDAACFLAAWFATAIALRLYTRPSRARLALTWLVGVTAAVGIRAAIVGHFSTPFYGVAVAFTALFVLVGRMLTRRIRTAGSGP
jgi:hypothetical protein